MALPQQKFREIIFQILYSNEYDADSNGTIELIMKQLKVTRSAVRKAIEKASHLKDRLPALDEKIESAATDYPLERISKVEHTILRLSLYEGLHEELPIKVAISEAVRLTRKFGSPEGAAFVNGVLDHIFNDGDRKEPEKE